MALVPKEGGSMSYQVPVLTSTNYPVWVVKVKSIMDAYGLWGTVEPRTLGEEPHVKKSKQALAFLFQAIPEDMVDANAHTTTPTQSKELESLRMKEGEFVDDFASKLTGLASKARSLHAVGRLKAYEERIKGAEKMEDTQGGLLLVSEGKSHGYKHCSNGGSNRDGFGRDRGRGRGSGKIEMHKPISESPFTSMAKVLFTAARKRNVVSPIDPRELYELSSDEGNIEFLGKAAVKIKGSGSQWYCSSKKKLLMASPDQQWYMDTGATSHLSSHTDLWTSPVSSMSGYKYYVLFLDHYLHFLWVYPLHRKSDAQSKLLHFRAFVKTQFNREIKAFQCDHGGEFDNNSLHELFATNGIQFRFSCPRTSQQNGKSERMIRTINNVVRSLLFQARLPPEYWVEALLTAAYLLNILPSTSINNDIPYTKLFNKPPSYTHLRMFGCLCYPYTFPPHKLAPRTTPSIFLGYPYNHRGYRCLDLNTNKIIISRHVTFDETVFPFGSMTPTKPPSYKFLDDNLDTSPIALRLLTTPTSPQQTPPQTTPQTTPQTNPQTTPQSTPPTPPPPTLPQPPPPPPTSQYPMVTRSKVGIVKANPKYNLHVIPSPYLLRPDTLYLLLYVDDIILTASSTSLMQRIISLLHAEFAMTDLGPLNYFLGISATRTTSGIFLPIDTEKKLGPEGSPVTDPTLYAALPDHFSTSPLPDRFVICEFKTLCLIRILLVSFHTPLFTATLVYCDNVSVVYMSANPVQHQRTKHIEIDIHFVRDKVAAGHVRVLHVPSRFQYADIFTKGLPYPLFADFRSSLSVRKSPAPTAGAY
ncbi:ribonuclease H-like domain-containing protein [Tanacetum coccineum]